MIYIGNIIGEHEVVGVYNSVDEISGLFEDWDEEGEYYVEAWSDDTTTGKWHYCGSIGIINKGDGQKKWRITHSTVKNEMADLPGEWR